MARKTTKEKLRKAASTRKRSSDISMVEFNKRLDKYLRSWERPLDMGRVIRANRNKKKFDAYLRSSNTGIIVKGGGGSGH